ncbi:MAG: type I-E CRISPR-associated protein Cas7/Cse4/CasC [Lachnoanaerobaculum saburreum]
MKSRLFLDMHIIQTLPPSNINRDDTGSPKTSMYGGVRRARVSSQSWKAAMRNYFKESGEVADVGVRTKDIISYVAKKIRDINNTILEKEALDRAAQAIELAGIKLKDNKDKSGKEAKALFFLGDRQATDIAKMAAEADEDGKGKLMLDKKDLQRVLKDNVAIDIALFGRMVADDPSLNEDASSQVAHAISTHAVQTEFDYFTAADDLSPEDNAGAGMIGNVEYNSSTLYRYANIALHEFLHQLKDKESMINAVKLFVEAFAKSLPTGKVNTFANQTLPGILVVNLREDRPVSLVSAFETPVKSEDGYIAGSIKKLSEEMDNVQKFVEKPVKTLYLAINNVNISDGEGTDSLNELLTKLGEEINQYQFN